MTESTPEPLPSRFSGRSAARRSWPTAAGVVCLIHVLVLAGLAVFYAVELTRGQGNPTTVLMSGVLILVGAGLLALLARAWFVRSRRAAVPTFLWNGLLIPVVVALYGADETAIATGLLLLVGLGLVTAVGAVATNRAD